MRQMFKTTTAIATCLSLSLPQVLATQSVAQDAVAPDQQGEGAAAVVPAVPKAQAEIPAEAAPQVTPEAPAEPAPQDAAAPEGTAPAEGAPADAPSPADPPETADTAPAQTQAAPPAEAEAVTEAAPAAAAEAAQSETPPTEPAAENAAPVETIEAAPVNNSAPAEVAAPEAAPTPPMDGAAPAEKPAAVNTVETAPASKPETANPPPAARPVEATEAETDALKKALEAEAAPEAAPQTVTETAPPAKPEAAAQESAAPAAKPQPDAAQAAPQTQTPPDEAALKAALEAEAAAKAPAEKPQTLPDTPPEANAAPTEVSNRAAEQVPPSDAAALQDDASPEGEVQETTITKDNVRSSAEDFLNAVTGNQTAPDAAAAAQNLRESEKDDRLSDVAKLLLAGAAGVAVGKMLDNNRQVALNTGDRVVVTLPDGSQQVIKDENALLLQPGSNVQTETFNDGSTRSTVLRADGSRVITIRDANMNILRRSVRQADGSETRLIDETEAAPVQVSTLPAPPPLRVYDRALNEDELRAALSREASISRRFSLTQIRDIPEVRSLVAPVDIPAITFDTGSAAITPDQARQLATLGKVIKDSVAANPAEVFMIEGYTDAVGGNAMNLALSDRRAESVALALTEYFQVPPENMVVQGYGEQFLLIKTESAERVNRRVAVRRITQLLGQN